MNRFIAALAISLLAAAGVLSNSTNAAAYVVMVPCTIDSTFCYDFHDPYVDCWGRHDTGPTAGQAGLSFSWYNSANGSLVWSLGYNGRNDSYGYVRLNVYIQVTDEFGNIVYSSTDSTYALGNAANLYQDFSDGPVTVPIAGQIYVGLSDPSDPTWGAQGVDNAVGC